MKAKIPVFLIYTRLILGVVIITLSIVKSAHYQAFIVSLLTIGLLSDIFDGIIARRIGVSTQKLRRLDSTIDQIFFLSVAVSAYIICPDFFTSHHVLLIVLLAFEAATYGISFIKFRKEIATHSIGAKEWTLLLVATLIQIILQCDSGVLFQFCFWIGILTRIEIIAIILVLRKWTNDVPTIYHAVRLRKNLEIKRNKLFNG